MVELSSKADVSNNPAFKVTDRYSINMSSEEKGKLAKNPSIVSITRNIKPKGKRHPRVFPNNENYEWKRG